MEIESSKTYRLLQIWPPSGKQPKNGNKAKTSKEIMPIFEGEFGGSFPPKIKKLNN